MQNEFKIHDAAGVVLFDNINVNGETYPKGYCLTTEDIKVWEDAGIKFVSGMRPEESDIGFDLALGIIGTKLSGNDIAYILDDNGILKLAAQKDGIFMASEERIAKFNKMSEAFVLNTIPPYSLVEAGDVVARLEMLPPRLPQEKIDDLSLRLSGNLPLLSVAEFHRLKVALLYGKFYKTAAEAAYFTRQVKKLIKNFSRHNLEFSGEFEAEYNTQAMADAIEQAVGSGYDIVFILSGLKSASSRDIVPSAMKSFVDDFIPCRMARVNGSDMYVGIKRQCRIVSLPHNYCNDENPVVDEMITKVLVNEKIMASDFFYDQNIPLPLGERLTETENLLLADHLPHPVEKGKADIAVVILAAGSSSRVKRNKLLIAGIDGHPLFMNAVKAAVSSDAGPVFVITGYQHEEIEEYLDGIDVNVIYNPSFRHGVKTSINLGLKLVPNICSGALLLPADMPNITAKHLNKMIAAFRPEKDKQLILTNFKGIRRNPVLWSRSLFDVADLVPENADVRAVFMEHEDYTTLINAGSEKLVLDVNYPADVDIVEQKEE